MQAGEEVRAHLRLGLFQPSAAGKNNVVAVLVEFDNLRLKLAADIRLQIAHAAHLDERSGQESTQTNIEDEATLDDLDYGAGDDAVLFLDLLDLLPGALVLCTLLGKQEAPFLIFLLKNEGFDGVADLDDVIRIDVVLNREFLGGNDTLGLVANVKKNFIVVDLDDSSFDDVAVIEVLDRLVYCGEQGFLIADIVDGNFGKSRGLGGVCCHVNRKLPDG